jgi:hypothetical protein
MTEVSPGSLLSGTLASYTVTGPLLSLVFRTEDVWQRYNQFIETAGLSIRVSPSHPYNAGRAGLGWMRERQCVCCMQWLCCGFGDALGESATRSLVRRSRGGRSAFYSKRFLRTHAHTHTRASTRPLILILVSCISLVYLCVVSLPLHDEVRAVLRTRAHTRIPAHTHTHAYAHLQLV